MLNRRELIGRSTLGVTALALFGCTATQVTNTLQQAASDANLIAASLKNVLPQIAAIPGVSATIVGKVGSAIADIQSLSAAIASSTSTSAALPSVQQYEADFNGIVSALSGLPLPPPVPDVLAAANVLLPIIELAVGVAVNAAAAPGQMTPSQARAVLAAH